MAASTPPSPKLGKSQALNIAQGTVNRLATLVPSLTTDLSPVTIYQPGALRGVGNELAAGSTPVSSSFGVWVAPDLNGNGSVYYVQVECFGGGGGAGGGNGTQGGGGGGGAEYACETQYPIVPGNSYVYAIGLPGTSGYNTNTSAQGVPGSAATSGGVTLFDIAGLGLAGGVTANPGQGGDQTSVGIGGIGGTGSLNSIHFNGGNGGTNVSGNGSDNPITLSQLTGMFTGNSLNPAIVVAWYVMNDNNAMATTRNDSSGNLNTGRWTNYTTPGFTSTGIADAPSQAPAYTSSGGGGLNPTQQGWASQFQVKSISSPSARFSGGRFTFSGTRLTVSGWVQAPSAATWGNTAAGSIAVITTNSTNYTGNSLKGYALYAFQNGTSANPSWQLIWAVGNASTRQKVTYNTFTATPGSWYYVVGTFNSGTLTLYVNGASVGTASAGFSSVPGGAFGTVIGLDPSSQSNWFFGLVSNFWWANDSATATLVTQAFGLTAPTGGSGGGASGGPSAAGGNGASASLTVGGAGGTPATQPASLATTTTAAEGGFAGGNTGQNGSTSTPAGGPYGAGGGAAGNMGSPPSATVLTIPFSVAATYNGPDATSNPGTPYSINQQNHPSSGSTSVLFAGGLAADTSSGSKNSILLLPKGLRAMLGSGSWTIESVSLTVTNAFPSNTAESILLVGYSSDTSLPQTYSGASLINYVGAVPVPIGAGAITYDLTSSGIATQLVNGTATAFILGPGSNPTFDAFSAPSGPQFYSSIYGPGAYDAFNNPDYPYLTITLQKTLTVQHGSPGSGGAILITAISNSDVPVAFAQAFAGADGGGNQYAQGFTGPTTAWNPSDTTPGSFAPETWHSLAPQTHWQTSTFGVNGFFYKLLPTGDVLLAWDITPLTTTPGVYNTLPVGYRPATAVNIISGWYGTGPTSYNDQFGPHLVIGTDGTITVQNLFVATVSLFGTAILPLGSL